MTTTRRSFFHSLGKVALGLPIFGLVRSAKAQTIEMATHTLQQKTFSSETTPIKLSLLSTATDAEMVELTQWLNYVVNILSEEGGRRFQFHYRSHPLSKSPLLRVIAQRGLTNDGGYADRPISLGGAMAMSIYADSTPTK